MVPGAGARMRLPSPKPHANRALQGQREAKQPSWYFPLRVAGEGGHRSGDRLALQLL